MVLNEVKSGLAYQQMFVPVPSMKVRHNFDCGVFISSRYVKLVWILHESLYLKNEAIIDMIDLCLKVFISWISKVSTYLTWMIKRAVILYDSLNLVIKRHSDFFFLHLLCLFDWPCCIQFLSNFVESIKWKNKTTVMKAS